MTDATTGRQMPWIDPVGAGFVAYSASQTAAQIVIQILASHKYVRITTVCVGHLYVRRRSSALFMR